MPLRDHFHAPLDTLTSWDLFHGQWPAMIVLRLNAILPPRYVAGPHIHPRTDYEVRIYDEERGRRLVAAVEIVSPSNKDRPETRRVFVAKCEALLRRGVSVSVIDLVTSRHFKPLRRAAGPGRPGRPVPGGRATRDLRRRLPLGGARG